MKATAIDGNDDDCDDDSNNDGDSGDNDGNGNGRGSNSGSGEDNGDSGQPQSGGGGGGGGGGGDFFIPTLTWYITRVIFNLSQKYQSQTFSCHIPEHELSLNPHSMRLNDIIVEQ